MKHIKKIFSVALAAVMLLSCVPSAFAATSETAVIDYDADASLTIYAFDWTNAYKDGVVTEDTFVSSGWQDTVVEETFIGATPVGGSPEQVLGNSQTSNGYAVKGVEFTIANIALPFTIDKEVEKDGVTIREVQMIYAIDRVAAADFLAALGLDDSNRYVLSDNLASLEKSHWFYTSDVIIDALADALENNATEVKNAMEAYVANNGGIKMPLTDEDGRTFMEGLDVGLWLVVETAVPETVTSTTDPFLISLPMTTVNNNTEGTAPEGGHQWNYDVTVYPKSTSGIPTLEKMVRESRSDTGDNNGFAPNLGDGFGHTATGSAGDTMEYQIISTLPTITSQATALSTYSFFDTIAPGMTYNKDVKIWFYTDTKLTHKATTWEQGDGRFAVSYSDDGQSMTVDITEAGLAEINGDSENINGSLYTGYSNYTVVVSYTAEINSDSSFVYGEEGNCNKVVLTWKRTSGDYYDTLVDDAHVYSFGLNLTKLFSDMTPENANAEGKYEHVKFIIQNDSDNYWLLAELDEAEGIYYVTGFTDDKSAATIFTPVTSGDEFGKVIIHGMEDDKYFIVETETADGYTLLATDLTVRIMTETDTAKPCDIYSEDVLGLLQNDPRYQYSDVELPLTNIPQKQLSHYGISVTADAGGGELINMLPDETSEDAEVEISILNTRGFDLPQTGDNGTWMYGVGGGVLMLAAVLVIFFAFKKKEDRQAA